MFYLLLLLFILILYTLVQRMKGNHDFLMILILPYFAALCSIILYVSKDTYYYNLIKDYFYLPDFLWRWLFFIDIGKSNIIRIMNASSLSILIISVYLVFHFYEPFSIRVQKMVKYVVWAYCLLQFILYDPFTNLKAYYFFYPARLTVQQYIQLEDRIYGITHAINIAVVLLCFLGLLAAFIKAPKLKLFRYNHLFLAISYATLAFVYIYFISSSPDLYLKVSRIAGTYSYRSLQLGSNAFIYRALPYILVPAAAVITYCAYMLTRLSGQASLKELSISKEISSSETTSKIFCHYIKNEILAIQSEVETLALNADDKDEVKETSDSIIKRCHTLYDRIDEIHRSTRTSELNLKQYSLQALIKETLSIFSHELDSVNVRLNLPPQPILAMVDPVYMEQALHNIIKNSIDAMEDTPAEKKELTVTLGSSRQWIAVDIKDTGKGISKENLENIFLPFYSSHPYSKHWGIGLTLTYKVIHAHEGKIVVNSTPGAGTTVEVLLPNITPGTGSSETGKEV